MEYTGLYCVTLGKVDASKDVFCVHIVPPEEGLNRVWVPSGQRGGRIIRIHIPLPLATLAVIRFLLTAYSLQDTISREDTEMGTRGLVFHSKRKITRSMRNKMCLEMVSKPV